MDAGQRVRDGRRQRDQLPLPEPLLRDRPGRERRRARSGAAPQPGHPVGQHAGRRLDRQGLLRGHLGGPERPDSKATVCNTPLGVATFQALRLPVLDGVALGLRVGQRPGRGRARDLRAVPPAVAVPRRLRREHERLVLAVQPRAAADRFRAHHRRRGHRARAAHPQRSGDDPEAACRHGRTAGQPLHAPAAAGHGVLERAVRGPAVARRAGGPLQHEHHAAGLQRTRGRERRLQPARRVGPARQPRLERRAAVPALRDRAHWRRSGSSDRRRASSTRSTCPAATRSTLPAG